MKEKNLISKRSALQVKLAVLQTRLNMWNEKVGKYEFELRTRTENPVESVESVGGANGASEDSVEQLTRPCGS